MKVVLQRFPGAVGLTVWACSVAGMVWQPAYAGNANAVCLGMAPSTIQAKVPTKAFTLRWMHSVEKILWEEDYRVEHGQLALVASRVRGSGAGMEPQEGSVLRNGAWEYRPESPTLLPKLRLTRSPYTKGYDLCWNGRCTEFLKLLGPPGKGSVVEVFPCESP